MALASRYYSKAISGNEIKNDSSTLLNAGNVNPALANNVTLAENSATNPTYGSRVTASVSPVSSGNVGIGVAIANGSFNVNTDGNYIAIMLGTKIAGTTSTVLRSAYGIPGNKNVRYHGDRRYGVNTWDSNHIITKHATAGNYVAASGLDGVTGAAADHGSRHPGELTFMAGDSDSQNFDYGS